MARVSVGEDTWGFLENGRRSAEAISFALAGIGRTLDSFGRILDWGCGPGRVLRWLYQAAPDAELFGADIDRLSIEWDRKELPFGSFAHIDPNPPLPYEDSQFDLVIGRSVLTHLDEAFQDRWLAELCRVTAPDGFVVLTVHGEFAFAQTEAASVGGQATAWREELSSRGILFIEDDDWTGGPYPDFYHSTFHAPWYIFAHWCRDFEVCAHIPRGDLGHQDVVVLRRRRDDETSYSSVEPAIRVGELPDAISTPSVARPPIAARGSLTHARELIDTGPRVDSPTRHGAMSRAWRRIVARGLRHGTEHQREIDQLLVGALLGDTDGRNGIVQAVLKKQGERITRLEEYAFDRVTDLETRVGKFESER